MDGAARLNLEAAVANRGIDPVIEAEVEVRGAGVGVAEPEAGDQHLLAIGTVVSVGIA